jgi:aminoglycoside phosphotransferase (APT) family kinase protein
MVAEGSGGSPRVLVTVDASRFREYLLSLWPDLDITNLSVIETGWDSRVAYVNESWIFRVPRGTYGAEALAVEAALLPELAEALPVQIPAFEYLSLDPPCAGYRKIDGATLDPEQASVTVAKELGRFLRALHSFPVDRARVLGVQGDVRAWREDLQSECGDFRNRVLPLLSAQEARRAGDLFDEFIDDDLNFSFRAAVVHADLGPDHILCSRNGLAGIIDWGDVRIGDPAIDFAWLANALPSGVVCSLIKSYGPAADAALLKRALFFHRLGPWHEVIYGFDVGGSEFVRSGVEGIRSRLP